MEFSKKALLLEHIAECSSKVVQPKLSCKQCGKVYKRNDLFVRHEATAHLPKADADEGQEPAAATPRKKRGRPAKKQESEKKDEIFNQLKQNMNATFPEETSTSIEMTEAWFETEEALLEVLEEILVGFLDAEILKRVGWPKRGVMSTLEEVLQVIGVEVDVGDSTVNTLRDMMMGLLGKFVGEEQLEAMTNNYTVDQILKYMADSTRSS